MKKNIALTAFLLTAGMAQAADSGFYALGNMGYNTSSLSGQTLAFQADKSREELRFDNSKKFGAIWELGIGYTIRPGLAVELSYADLGSSSSGFSGSGTARMNGQSIAKSGSGQVSLNTSAYRFAVLGLYPVTQDLDLYGKASLNAINTRASLTLKHAEVENRTHNTKTTFKKFDTKSASDHSVRAGIGMGMQYRVNKQFALRGEYEYLFGKTNVAVNDQTILKGSGIHLAKIGVAISF
ncbi:outer membrane beta-barrel protein [Paludibacterium paludis]|nr:outer membrane beta-barrel protein [Paludibacterium paludis]